MKQIGEELGVSYLVEGSVRKSGERVRITAQLNDATTGKQLWAERYDRRLSAVFAIQDEIAEAIVAAIEPQVYAAESFRAQRKAPESLDAWDLVMRALSHYWRVTQQDNLVARQLLERAIAIDPNYAQALAVFAVSYSFGAHMGWEDAAIAVPVAERAAMGAVRADGEDPWAHLALATVYVHLGRFDDSLAQFEIALRLNSNFSLALGYYGLVLSSVGRWQEGAVAARRALRLSPRDPFSAIYTASRAPPSASDATTRRRCGWRARRRASGTTSSAPAACSPPPPPWRARPISPRPRCASCAARSPPSRSPGSRASCR